MYSTFTKILGVALFAATAGVIIYSTNLSSTESRLSTTSLEDETENISKVPNTKVHISELLNEDGTINNSMEYRGPVDLSGFHVVLDPLKGPLGSALGMMPMMMTGTETWGALSTGIGSSIVYALAVASNGDVYVGGSFTGIGNSGNLRGNRIVMWDKSADSWIPLGKGLNGECYAIAIASNGDVYAGGTFDNARNAAGSNIANTMRIARWDGSSWSALNQGLASTVNGIAIDGSNVYAVGDFDDDNDGTTLNKVGRWDGTDWNAMNGGLSNVCYAVAIGSGGDVYVGGDFENAGSVGAADRIAKWNSSGGWSALQNGTSGVVRAIAYVSDTEIYAGGEFTDIGTRVAQFNGTSWSNVSGGRASTVHALAVEAGGNLYAGGGILGILFQV